MIDLSKEHNTVVRRCSIQLKIQPVHCCKAWHSTALQQLSNCNKTRFPASTCCTSGLPTKKQPLNLNKYLFTIFSISCYNSTVQLSRRTSKVHEAVESSTNQTYSTKIHSLVQPFVHRKYLFTLFSILLPYQHSLTVQQHQKEEHKLQLPGRRACVEWT